MTNRYKYTLLVFVVMFSVAALAQTETQSKAPSIAVNSVYKGYRILYEDEEGVFLAEKHGKRGLIDYDGEILVPAKYEDVCFDNLGNGDFFIKKKGKWGIMDDKGKIILPCEYDYIELYPQERQNSIVYVVVKNGKFGKIKTDGEVIIPFEYDGMTTWVEHEKGCHYVYQNKKMGIIDEYGKVLVPPVFESVERSFSGRVLVFDGKKFGLYDIKTQSFAIPLDYDYLFVACDLSFAPSHQDPMIVALKDEQWMAFDSECSRNDSLLESEVVKNAFRFQEKEYFVDGKPDISKMYCTYQQIMMRRNHEVPVSDCIYEILKNIMTNFGYPMDKINVDDYLRYRMGYDLYKPKLEDEDY